MIDVSTTKQYRTHFRKRITSHILQKRYRERLEFFINNPTHPLLHDHQLKGDMKNYRAFSIAGDIRVVYFLEDTDHAIFIDIGTHNQVYS
jgi:addiction module RelE/StbE family toxin